MPQEAAAAADAATAELALSRDQLADLGRKLGEAEEKIRAAEGAEAPAAEAASKEAEELRVRLNLCERL